MPENLRSLATWTAAVALLLSAPLTMAAAGERDTGGARTVLGSKNPELSEGAEAMLSGNVERGIRLTRRGLEAASNNRERLAGLSNLCAGYLRLAEWDTAMSYCDAALELNPRFWRALVNRALIHIHFGRYADADADLDLAEEIAPGSRNLQAARALWRDAADPVLPTVVIDDRRSREERGDDADD
jgi:tetratricopeptide (TPR) repeat protein